MQLSHKLAAWCADTTLDFPDSAIGRAETAIADVIGCLLGGRGDAAVISAGNSITDGGNSGKSSAVSHAQPIASCWAALINGCAAHALDFDDNFFPAITHASASLVPALLALAEERDATAAEIVRAYIIGLEVEAQIGKLVNPAHYESGWHATSTIGTIGTAAACAALMRLDANGILHAISISYSLAGGSKRQFGSAVKPMHAGFAAMHGVLAAKLAAAGLVGVEETLQGRWSFAELYAGQTHRQEFLPALFPAAPLAIDEYGLVAKLYPSCMSSHLGIDALLALRSRHEFNNADIERIDIHMPAFMVANLRYTAPVTPSEARFSMNYCAAVVLTDGIPRMHHFSGQALQNPEIKRLLPLVHMHARAAAADAASLPWGGDCLAQVTLRDGSRHEQYAIYPKGCQQNPLTEQEQRDKFRDCAGQHVAGLHTDALFDAFRHFSQQASLRDLLTCLRA